jgi:hypothetical protein
VASRVSPGQSLLTALAGLTAYEAGAYPGDLLDTRAEKPEEAEQLRTAADAFAAALAVASRLAEEVRRLGGDPDALRLRIYDKASELAYS